MMFEHAGKRYTHATANAYVNGKCRCALCKEENRLRAATRRKLQAYGRYESAFVDAQPARDHVNSLRAHGWGIKHIAKLSGVGASPLGTLIFGRTEGQQNEGPYARPKHLQRISRVNSQKLLALRFSNELNSAGHLVSTRGIVRRAQALVCNGYSFAWQAKQLGLAVANYHALLERRTCSQASFDKVAALYEQFWNSKRVARARNDKSAISRALNQAKQLKYVPAMGWDYIDLDETPPFVERDLMLVDEMKIQMALDGYQIELQNSEKVPVTLQLAKRGMTISQIAHVTNATATAVEKRLLRNRVAA
jgi:hypothetical protein